MKKSFALIVVSIIVIQFVQSCTTTPKKSVHCKYPDPEYVVSPDKNTKDPIIKMILTEPWKSKGLVPVTLKFGNGKPLVICENGKPKIKIIAPFKYKKKTYGKYYRDIAKEIKYFLDLATGLNFEIIDDPGNTKIKGIYIGPLANPLSQKLYKQAQKGKDESFMIKSFKNGLMIAGKDAVSKYGFDGVKDKRYKIMRTECKYCIRGTYFGALDILERFIGIRCYSPGRVGTYVPPLKGRTVKIPDMSYADAPVFGSRIFGNSNGGFTAVGKRYQKTSYRRGRIWGDRRRESAASMVIGNHTDCFWEEFYLDKPNFFALRKDGTRMVGKRGPQSSQRCYTDEEGFQQHMKNIDNWYKYGDRTGKEYRTFTRRHTTPNRQYIYWLPNDGYPGCFCKKCKKLVAKYPKHLAPKIIQEYYYLGKLSEYARKKWPGKIIDFDMYSQPEIPKEFRHLFPKNIQITKVFNGYGLEAFWKEKKYLDYAENLIKDLNKLSCKKMIFWSHYPIKPREAIGIDMPAMVPHYLVDFYRKHKNDIGGATVNLRSQSYAHDTYIIYLYQSLLWNPDVDPDAMLDEFCSLIYGPAAKEMLEYYKLLIKSWENTRWSNTPDIVLYGAKTLVKALPENLYWEETYPTAVREELQNLLRTAWSKTKPNTIYHERMQFMNDATAKFFKLGHNFDTLEKMVTKSNKAPKIKIDGNLQEWAEIKPIILKESTTGKDAKIKTEFFIANDDKNIYIAGKVYEPEKMILPKGKVPHDSPKVYQNDSIEVFFSPVKLGDAEAKFNKASRFYQIIMNANGDVLDTHRPIYKKGLISFNLDFEHAEKAMGKGWQFEIKIPFKSMEAMTPEPGMTWLANFYRNRKRNDGSERYYAWSPTMGDCFFDSSTFGVLEF